MLCRVAGCVMSKVAPLRQICSKLVTKCALIQSRDQIEPSVVVGGSRRVELMEVCPMGNISAYFRLRSEAGVSVAVDIVRRCADTACIVPQQLYCAPLAMLSRLVLSRDHHGRQQIQWTDCR